MDSMTKETPTKEEEGKKWLKRKQIYGDSKKSDDAFDNNCNHMMKNRPRKNKIKQKGGEKKDLAKIFQ